MIVPSDLPAGWVLSTVKELFRVWGGMTPSTANPAYWGGTIPWISSKDVKGERVGCGTEFITERALRETHLKVAQPGSVLVVVRSGVLAHTLPVALSTLPVVVNQDVKVLDSGDRALNEWLALCLRACERSILEKNRKEGTTVQSIRVNELLNLRFPVPPTAEQQRITERATAMLAEVQKAGELLDSVARVVSHLPGAILRKAFTGELVLAEAELARAEGHEYEPASIMLQRLATQLKTNGSHGKKARGTTGNTETTTRARKTQVAPTRQKSRR